MNFISLINNYHIEMKKEFTKEDLKSGMWIECRNGYRYLLIHAKGELCGYRDTGINPICNYANDLTYKESKWDIVKVWHYDNPMSTNEADFGVDKLVWKRNAKKDQIKSKIDEIQRIVDDMQEDIKQKLESINKLKEELK